jgi:hypothetical protein
MTILSAFSCSDSLSRATVASFSRRTGALVLFVSVGSLTVLLPASGFDKKMFPLTEKVLGHEARISFIGSKEEELSLGRFGVERIHSLKYPEDFFSLRRHALPHKFDGILVDSEGINAEGADQKDDQGLSLGLTLVVWLLN